MKKYCISYDTSLLDSLRAIDLVGTGIVLGVDEEFRLIGTVSDGDIRRALIRGHSLESPVGPHFNRNCFSVTPETSRNDVLDIMKARMIDQVPILDDKGKVTGLHLLTIS